MRVNEALIKAGIEIPFPQQDVRIRSIAPEALAELAKEPPSTDATTLSRENAARDPKPRSAMDTTNLAASRDPGSDSDSDPF
jgi:hypothetical protein